MLCGVPEGSFFSFLLSPGGSRSLRGRRRAVLSQLPDPKTGILETYGKNPVRTSALIQSPNPFVFRYFFSMILRVQLSTVRAMIGVVFPGRARGEEGKRGE